jgi:hypothetical protein
MAAKDYTPCRVYCEYFCLQIALPRILGPAADSVAGVAGKNKIVGDNCLKNEMIWGSIGSPMILRRLSISAKQS